MLLFYYVIRERVGIEKAKKENLLFAIINAYSAESQRAEPTLRETGSLHKLCHLRALRAGGNACRQIGVGLRVTTHHAPYRGDDTACVKLVEGLGEGSGRFGKLYDHKCSSRANHTIHFTQPLLQMAEVAHTISHGNSVEFIIPERHLQRVSFYKFHAHTLR